MYAIRSYYDNMQDLADSAATFQKLLDPPLHEFLPTTEAEMQEVAKAAGVDVDTVKDLV